MAFRHSLGRFIFRFISKRRRRAKANTSKAIISQTPSRFYAYFIPNFLCVGFKNGLLFTENRGRLVGSIYGGVTMSRVGYSQGR